MENKKQMNYELMRIVSMFLIVLYHTILHGRTIINCQNENIKFIFEFIELFTLVHVNSFVLLTGYFNSDKKFKQSKIWSIINANWFYRIVIFFVFVFIGLAQDSKIVIFKELFPIPINEYWFIKVYLLLYILAPFLNAIISKLKKVEYRNLLIVTFIIFSILPYVSNSEIFNNNGFSLYSFVYLYLLGGYLKKYPIKENYIFKNISKKAFQIILVTGFFIMLIANFVNYKFAISISGMNEFFDYYSKMIQTSVMHYSNPFVLFQSVAYFLFFGTLNVKNTFIGKISKLVFGVYLISDNNYMRAYLYSFLKIDNGPIYSYKFIIYVILISILIYITCIIIEWLRQIIFKFIYDLKISSKLREKYYIFINDIFLIKNKEV